MKGMTFAAAAVAAGLVAVVLLRQNAGEELPDFGALPEFRLVDSSGAAFTRADLGGRPWIANFIFTSCPSFCPRLTTQMAGVQRRLDDVAAVQLLSISVDPETDTPEVLRAYAAKYGAAPETWRFVTGERRAVHELVRNGFRLAVEERGPGQVVDDGQGIIVHSDRFVLIDGRGHIRGYYSGNDAAAMDELVAAARRLAADS